MVQSVWITCAHIAYPNQSERYAAVMAYAEHREDFSTKLSVFCEEHQLKYRYHLAPLEASTFFTRHGRTWLLSEAKSLDSDEVRIVYLDEEPTKAVVENKDYVLRHIINDVVPFDRQFGRTPKLFAPDEIFKLL